MGGWGIPEINEKINKLIRSEYKHTDISETLLVADEFMQMVHNVFLKLAQLDFIGKKKGKGHLFRKKLLNGAASINSNKQRLEFPLAD